MALCRENAFCIKQGGTAGKRLSLIGRAHFLYSEHGPLNFAETKKERKENDKRSKSDPLQNIP
jgi:hypothetical protein